MLATDLAAALAYVYGHADERDAQVAKSLTLDEARRIASNIAKLPALLGKGVELPPSICQTLRHLVHSGCEG